MSEERLYDLATIAKALKLSLRAVTNRANTGAKRRKEKPWPVHSTELRRGQKTRLYAYSTLPKDVRIKIDHTIAAAQAEARLRELEAEHAREMAEAGAAFGAQEKAKAVADNHARLRRIEEGRKKFSALAKDDPKKLRAKAREWVINDCSLMISQECMELGIGRAEYARQVNAGERKLPSKIEAWMPMLDGKLHLTQYTLQRWTNAYHEKGIWALKDNYGNRKGQSKIETNKDLLRLILGAIIKYPHITPKKIKAWLKAEYSDLDIVSVKGIERFLKRWKDDNPQLWIYITNPDRWKNIYMAAAGSMFEDINRLNQLWELDSTPGDWMLKDGRHTVVGAIDLYSRRLKFYVSKTSTAAAVKQLMRRCILDWGVPEAVRTDNGADYVSEDVDSLLRDLDIIHEICIPFASEEKGTIERAFRTMSHGLLDLLPGFIGHNVAERKVIEARKSFAQRIMKSGEVVDVELTSDELQEKLDDWADHVYAKDKHSGLNGKTPWAVANAWSSPIRKISDEHALDELLLDVVGTRTITKKGIRFDNRTFIDQSGLMHEHVGREVYLKRDERDIGRLAVYMDSTFLCWAEDPDITGINRREAAAAIKHHVKKRMSEQAAELKEYKKEIKTDIAQAVLDHRKEKSENVTELPKRSEPYSTPALEAAAEAAAARSNRAPQHRELTESEKRAKAKLAAEIQQSGPATVHSIESPKQRYARWLETDRRQRQGEALTEAELRWHASYPQSAEYRAQKAFHEDFGLVEAK